MNDQQEFKSKLQDFFNQRVQSDPLFKQWDGSVAGFYKAGITVYREKHHTLWVNLSGFSGGSLHKSFPIPLLDVGNKDEYLKAIESFFDAHHFISSSKEMEQGDFDRVLLAKIKKKQNDHPEEFAPLEASQIAQAGLPEGITGLLQTHVELTPSGLQPQAGFALRPAADYINAGKIYLKGAHSFSFDTGHKDPDAVRRLIKNAENALRPHGICEFDIRLKRDVKNPDKIIPLHLIDLNEIFVRKGVNESTYALHLTPNKNRKPPIKLNLGTIDPERADAIKIFAVNEFLPQYTPQGALHGVPLTLRAMQEAIESRFPRAVRTPKPQRYDIRRIEANGNTVVELLTPSMLPILRSDGVGYRGTLRFAPPGNETAIQTIPRVRGENLNTSDSRLALQRLNTLQNLAEIALIRFFTQNPDMNIPIESVVKTRNRKDTAVLRFHTPQPEAKTKAGEIFFENIIATIIEPALVDYNRYLYWQTEVKEEEGKWRVICEARRNKGEGDEIIPPDVSSFSGPFTLEANDELHARKFSHALELAILEEQQFYSRNRRVEQFGEKSAQLVIRDSLVKALREHKGNIDLNGNNTLNLLGRSF